MNEETKDGKGSKEFCFRDFPPWSKRAMVRKAISDANELLSINGGAAGVWLVENEEDDVPDYTGHHRNHVFGYHDVIRLSAAAVDEMAKTNPRFAQIFHGNLAEPKLSVRYLDNPLINTKSVTADNPLHFEDRDISAPQRERIKEELYKLSEVLLNAGVFEIKKK
jgi:hypothetical protein